jgi:glucosylglycerate hydrolase
MKEVTMGEVVGTTDAAAPPRPWTAGELTARAAYVLRANSAGTRTRAAPDLYPHQWSWDSAFVAAGLAHVDLERACLELNSLLAGQWRTGMIPHIVFDPAETGYFPGPDRWACAEHTTDAPTTPRTSGICQPPVHALAVERIVEMGADRGSAAEAAVDTWLAAVYPRLLAWHRYLARHRDPTGSGLLTIYHGWESGMDNSPRWDEAYSRVTVGPDLPPYQRRDTRIVTDTSQRPSTVEYDRYLWIVEQLKRADYDDERIRESVSFLVTDGFMSAIFAVANEALAGLAERLGAAEAGELRDYADRFRRGVVSAVDEESGLALDRDLRTQTMLDSQTVAGFAPLICGGLDSAAEARMVDLLKSTAWTGHPDLRHQIIPSTSPESAAFRPRTYWRGPSWPVMNWFFAWMLQRRGIVDVARSIRRAGLDELSAGGLGEYYQPLTGEPLGSMDQSWTAAAALDLLLAPDWRT